MKKLTTHEYAYLERELTTIALCWKIKLSNGDTLSFTEHDREIYIDGIKYIPGILIGSTAIESVSALLPNNLNIELSLHNSKILNVESNYYEGASVEVMIVNFMDSNPNGLNVFSGYITSIVSTPSSLKARVQSYSDQLNNTVGEIYSPLCRANFCDSRCKLSAENFSIISHIDAVINESTFFSKQMKDQENGIFNYGYIELIRGDNSSNLVYIKENHEGVVILSTIPKFRLTQGDKYRAVLGCNKQFETCVKKFNNAVNFRGEPHVPSYDELM